MGSIWRLDWADKSVWVMTFALTVMANLTLAVETGMALAALLYIYRVTETTSVSRVTREDIEDGRAHVRRTSTFLPTSRFSASTDPSSSA